MQNTWPNDSVIRTMHASATQQHTSCGVSDMFIGSSSQGVQLFCAFDVCTATCFEDSNVIVGWCHRTTRWFKYDRDWFGLFTHKSVPVIFEPPCTLICECLPPYWIFCSSFHTNEHYTNQKPPHCSAQPIGSVNSFQDIRGNISNKDYILRLLKNDFFFC